MSSPTADEVRRFFPAAQFGDVCEVVPITMGQSGANVSSVTTGTGEYILRFHGGEPDSWQRVRLMQQVASEHGIAPLLVHVDEAARATVSARIAGVSFGAAVSQQSIRAAAFGSLVDVLRTLHAIPGDRFTVNDPIAFARSVWDGQVQRAGFPAWAMPLGDRIAEADTLVQQDPRLVLSHCDLHPANMLWDGQRVWLVDWERAGPAHPYLDLATISNFMALADEVAVGLLERQEQTPLNEDQKLLFAGIRDLCRIVYGAVFFRLVDDLASVEFASREETLALGDCFAMMSTGALALNEARGRALIGAAFLKQCESKLPARARSFLT